MMLRLLYTAFILSPAAMVQVVMASSGKEDVSMRFFCSLDFFFFELNG